MSGQRLEELFDEYTARKIPLLRKEKWAELTALSAEYIGYIQANSSGEAYELSLLMETHFYLQRQGNTKDQVAASKRAFALANQLDLSSYGQLVLLKVCLEDGILVKDFEFAGSATRRLLSLFDHLNDELKNDLLDHLSAIFSKIAMNELICILKSARLPQ